MKTAMLSVLLVVLGAAAGGTAHAAGGIVLLSYGNDVDGPLAHQATAWAPTAHPLLGFVVGDTRAFDRAPASWPADAVRDAELDGFAVDCVVAIGRDARDHGAIWALDAPVVVAQGTDRYSTAVFIRGAIADCARLLGTGR